MKRLKDIFICACMVVFVSLTTNAKEKNGDTRHVPSGTDSIAISLLTCSPGNQVWSLYGHTAIRFQDQLNDVDLTINYGMFNFHQKNFILRFVFGITDYEMGIEPFQVFLQEYARNGRGVIEQKLNLTNEEKLSIASAIYKNYEPANRTYRYNYFYDNCTTRARDIIVNNLNGKVEYPLGADVDVSYRQMIHQWNKKHLWARFGNDLLLGIRADLPTKPSQQQFLPDTLRKDFAKAKVVSPDGQRRNLVDSTIEILKAKQTDTETNIWDDASSPRCVFLILGLIILGLSLLELKRKKLFVVIDALLLTLDGLAGLILLAMVFSQHPTVNANLQILLLNPLSIIFVYPVINQKLKETCHWYWKLFLTLLVMFLLGNIFQDYAEGMNFLALTLMVRCLLNIKTLKEKGKQRKEKAA